MERQAPFLKSVLQEANQHKRQELLRMANADQINAISELVMNTLCGTVPRSRHTITLLKSHAQSLRAMAKPAHSVKRRRAIMMAQTGGTLWPELYSLTLHALDPAPQLHHGTRNGEHLSGQCPRLFTITRQVQTRIGGRYPLDQSRGFGGQTTCSWPVMPPMPGNDLNSKPWGVNYAIGPKKSANRLGPRPVVCAPRVPRPLATMILRRAPCKRGSRNWSRRPRV